MRSLTEAQVAESGMTRWHAKTAATAIQTRMPNVSVHRAPNSLTSLTLSIGCNVQSQLALFSDCQSHQDISHNTLQMRSRKSRSRVVAQMLAEAYSPAQTHRVCYVYEGVHSHEYS